MRPALLFMRRTPTQPSWRNKVVTKDLIEYMLDRILGCSNVASSSGQWVIASCPLAPWTHAGGVDRRPSFGVYLGENGSVGYNCFACGAKGTLPTLLHTLTWLSGQQDLDFLRFILSYCLHEDEKTDSSAILNEVPSVFDREARTKYFAELVYSHINYARRPQHFIPNEFLEEIPLVVDRASTSDGSYVLKWLCDVRKISIDVIREYQLRLFCDEYGRLGVVFPVLSMSGLVHDLWVRLIDEKRFFRLKRTPSGREIQFRSPQVWYGIHALNLNESDPLLVEGALDLLRLRTLGERNVLASFGFPSRSRIASIPCSSFFLAFDADDAGRSMSKFVLNNCKRYSLLILNIDWSVVGVKDPGELESKEQLEAAKDAAVVCFDGFKYHRRSFERYSPFKKLLDASRARSRKEVLI